MKLFKTVIALLFLICFVNPIWATADLIEVGKSDSTIKMLVFPKSLRVIENRLSTTGKIDAFLSDSKQIRKTLLKVDLARVAPAYIGELFSGPVTRSRLRELAKLYSEDIFIIFRRNFRGEDGNTNSSAYNIEYRGLIYLARQKKVLALKGNDREGRFADSKSTDQTAKQWQEIDIAGLKTLAKEAKKILQSHKFEKRQSAY